MPSKQPLSLGVSKTFQNGKKMRETCIYKNCGLMQGLGLPELLLSIFLASFVLLIAIQSFLFQKNHFSANARILERENELSMVADLLRDSILHAGYTPCGSITDLLSRDHRLQNQSVQALKTGSSPGLFLKTARLVDHYATLNMAPEGSRLVLPEKLPFELKHSVLIADCQHAEVHTIDAVERDNHRTVLQLKTPLHFKYRSPTYIGRWLEQSWVLQKDKAGKPVLFLDFDQKVRLSDQVREVIIGHDARLMNAGIIALSLLDERNKCHDYYFRMRNQ